MVDPIKLKRHSDENLKQWKLRICENYKEYGLSNWNEVAEVINKETGDKKGESAYRKWFTNFNEGRDYQKEVVAEENGAIVELELKKIEVMEERKKLQAMKNEIHKKRESKAEMN